MNFEYKLSRNDYIEFQFFAATKSEMIKIKKKARNRLPIIYIILGTILLIVSNKIVAFVFYSIGILWYLFYPGFAKKRYKKHYSKYVDENFKNRFGTLITVKISDDYETIDTSDFESESKFKISEIEKIFEIKRFIYIKMKSGSHLIIPKYKIENIDKIRDEFILISKSNGFDIMAEPDLDFQIEQ